LAMVFISDKNAGTIAHVQSRLEVSPVLYMRRHLIFEIFIYMAGILKKKIKYIYSI
jgi:hypothetical protein